MGVALVEFLVDIQMGIFLFLIKMREAFLKYWCTLPMAEEGSSVTKCYTKFY